MGITTRPDVDIATEFLTHLYVVGAAAVWICYQMQKKEKMEKKDETASPQDNQFMALRESRRMRSNELHYLDHPALGVITKISPYSIDSNIAKRWLEAQNPEPVVN